MRLCEHFHSHLLALTVCLGINIFPQNFSPFYDFMKWFFFFLTRTIDLHFCLVCILINYLVFVYKNISGLHIEHLQVPFLFDQASNTQGYSVSYHLKPRNAYIHTWAQLRHGWKRQRGKKKQLIDPSGDLQPQPFMSTGIVSVIYISLSFVPQS